MEHRRMKPKDRAEKDRNSGSLSVSYSQDIAVLL